MNFSVDVNLFERVAHNPSFGALKRSLPNPTQGLVDYCVPVNPYFPTAEMMSSYRSRLEEILKYYPETGEPIAEVLASVFHINPECLIVANGSTEIITWIDHLYVKDSLITPIPTFGRWTDQPLETGKRLITVLRKPEDDFHLDVDDFVQQVYLSKAKAAAICNPNNPTGALSSRKELTRLLDKLSHLDIVVIDESFLAFSRVNDVPSMEREAMERENVIVVKSLGKNCGLHGVRMGYAITNKRLAKHLGGILPKWNINAIAEAVIRDLPLNFEAYEKGRIQVIADRNYLYDRLNEIPQLKVYPSSANFVFFKVPDSVDGKKLRNTLVQSYGYLVRECGNKIGSSSNYFRVAANPPEMTDQLVQALGDLLSD